MYVLFFAFSLTRQRSSELGVCPMPWVSNFKDNNDSSHEQLVHWFYFRS